MGAKAALTMLLAALVALLIAMWAPFGVPAPRDAARAAEPRATQPEPAAAAVPALAETGAPAARTAGAADSGREAVPAAADAATGSLLVRATWEDDGKPAADVLVALSLRGSGDRLFDAPRGTTDARGEARFDGLQPGTVHAYPLRGGYGSWAKAAIEPGRLAEVELRIETALTVRGIVVDERGAPFPGAEIVVADWGGGEGVVLAHSGADGTFALRAIATHCHVGARAPGYSPTCLRQFTADKGAEATLRLELTERAAAVRGTVLDAQDRPVAGAVAQLGDREQRNRRLPDGGVAMAPRPQRVRTDGDGRFEFASPEPGRQPLAVRARGLAPRALELEVVAGRAQDVTVRLTPGVTLVGTVRSAAGEPVAGAAIEIGRWDDLGHRSARSDAAGGFRCEDLATGPLAIRVEADGRGKAHTTIDGAPGATVRWDPVLAAGLVLRGRVVDADGKAVQKAMVEARRERPEGGEPWWAFENTDGEGRFALQDCAPGQPIRIDVRRKSTFSELTVRNVVPGAEECLIRLPAEVWVHIRGIVLDPDGRALPSVHVSPYKVGSNSGSPAETANKDTGAFDLGPYPPGEYRLDLRADGHPRLRLGPRTLAGDEVWDLGTLRFPRGGTLQVALIAATVGAPPPLVLEILDAQGQDVDRLETQDGRATSGPLAAGDYLLQVRGQDVAAAQVPFAIRAGAVTKLDVRLLPGTAVEIRCVLPADADPLSAQVVVADASGTVVLRGRAFVQAGARQLKSALQPGEYRVAAQAGDLHGEAALVVTAGTPARVEVTLAR